MRMDGQTDMTKLIAAFRNFAYWLKINNGSYTCDKKTLILGICFLVNEALRVCV